MKRFWVILSGVVVGFAALVGAGIAVALATRDRCGLPGIEEYDPQRLPIHVQLSGELAGPRWNQALVEAVRTWNDALGAEVFVRELSAGGSICPIMSFPAWEERGQALARANLTLTPNRKGIATAAVYVDTYAAQCVTYGVLRRALAHEMGHVLGLAHDDIRDSMMFAKALPEEPYITANDVGFLREAYDLT